MFRFFPTVAEEWSAIGDAMRMRGVRFGGGKAGAILEYRIVPMMICSVRKSRRDFRVSDCSHDDLLRQNW